MGFDQRLAEVRTGFERSFWVANVSELFERLSYYAAFASLARYLHEALNFPTERAADLSGLFGGLVWFLEKRKDKKKNIKRTTEKKC